MSTPAASSPPPPAPQTPAFEIIDRLGAGSMGTVYRALDRTHQRVVALKVISRQDARGRERFLNEGRIQARLHHPHIARLHAVTTW
ncbi:MAG: protein kinase, partial [Bacteroidota bacterium]